MLMASWAYNGVAVSHRRPQHPWSAKGRCSSYPKGFRFSRTDSNDATQPQNCVRHSAFAFSEPAPMDDAEPARILGGRREGRQICLLPDARPKPVTGRRHAGGARAPHRAALTGAPTTGRSWSRSRWTFSRTTGLDAVTSLLADGLGKVAAGCFSPTVTATPSSQRPRLLPRPARRSAAGAAWRDGFGPHRPLRTSLACLGGVPHRRREEIEGEEREKRGRPKAAARRLGGGRGRAEGSARRRTRPPDLLRCLLERVMFWVLTH